MLDICLGEIPGARLAAVCDVEPARLQNVSEKYGEDVQAFDSADALFEAKCIDAVIVATPHYFHPPLVTQALERGYHAMSEKPAGVYQAGAANERGRGKERPSFSALCLTSARAVITKS